MTTYCGVNKSPPPPVLPKTGVRVPFKIEYVLAPPPLNATPFTGVSVPATEP